MSDLPKRKDGSTPMGQRQSADKKTKSCAKQKKLKDSDIFLNDQITQKINELFAEARQLKKEGKIFGTWTMNCL